MAIATDVNIWFILLYYKNSPKENVQLAYCWTFSMITGIAVYTGITIYTVIAVYNYYLYKNAFIKLYWFDPD